MLMRHVMKPARWVVRKDTRLATAQHLMAKHRIRELPVVEAGKLVGLLSEPDILAYWAKAPASADWWRSPVSAAMQIAPRTAGPDDELDLDELAADRVEMLPVVENDLLIGVVHAADALDAEIRARSAPRRRAEATAAEAMTERPWTVRPDDSLLDAAKLMVDYEVRHLPVVEDGELVGMLSDRDIRTVVGDPARYLESEDTRLSVHDAMTTNPVTVTADRKIRDIAMELVEDEVGAVPVVDAAGKLVGIISYVDALRALAA